MPPELVSPPGVLRDLAQWSPDASYVIARREVLRLTSLTSRPSEGEVSLVLWSAKTHRSVEIWKQPWPAYDLGQAQWLTGANVAYAVATWTPPALPGNPAPEERQTLAHGPAVGTLGRAHIAPEGRKNRWNKDCADLRR